MLAVIVDDNYYDRLFLEKALNAHGQFTQFVTFENGVDIIGKLEKLPSTPDVLITDSRMPMVSGLDILTLIKSHSLFKHIPVILCSNSSNDVEVDNARQLGANAFMVKPRDFSDYEKTGGILENILAEANPGYFRLVE